MPYRLGRLSISMESAYSNHIRYFDGDISIVRWELDEYSLSVYSILRIAKTKQILHTEVFQRFMTMDRIILIGIWIITCLLLIYSIPLHKIRQAFVIFTFKQTITWLLGVLVVEYKLIEYPVREFSYAIKTSFSFEYFIYPSLCCVFVLKFPQNKSILKKILWYLFFPSWMTILEVVFEKYTNLVHYISWHWYWTWLSLLATFFLSHMFYLWFMKKQTGGAGTV